MVIGTITHPLVHSTSVVNTNMAKKLSMGFLHNYCRANGQAASTMRKGHDLSQYDHTIFSQYVCAP
jgi:hypothetical protein